MAGARVALIDGSHPREKPCGGGVTGRAFELIASAVPQSSLSTVAVQSASFAAAGRSADVSLAADISGPAALAIVARRHFDAALLAAATRAGADHVAARATDLELAAAGWTVELGTQRLTTTWLIGADGAASMVRKRVSTPFPRSELSVAAGYFVDGSGSAEIAIDFDDVPTGYVWSFPRRDHFAVGACGQADLASSAALQRRTARWVDQHLPRTSMHRYSWPIPSLGLGALLAEQPAGPNWMLVGDAAGLVDPITREGIYFALLSGEIAAASLSGSEAVVRYTAALRASVYEELQRAARLKARFFKPELLALLIRGLDRSKRVRAIMADLVSGRQSYVGLRRRLLSTLEVRLMLDLFFRT
jgi:flavin-dependent dehydrogenase